MNKKVIGAIVAVVLVVAIVIGGYALLKTSDAPKKEFADTADVINQVLATYDEDKKFPSVGGDMTTPVDGKAGLMSLDDPDSVDYMLHTNEDLRAQVDEVASYVHQMLANNFTSGSFKLKDAKTADDFCTSLEKTLSETQWMCGIPDKMVIFTVNGGDYVVYAVGGAENIDYFKAQFTATMGESATILTDRAVKE